MLFKVILPLGLLVAFSDALHSAMLRGAREPHESQKTESHANRTTHTQNFFISERTTASSSTTAMPQMFVAIFSKRSSPVSQRNAIRDLWREVDDGSGVVCARFAMCSGQDNFQQSLIAENQQSGDLLFLPCTEGYAEGLLTKKVIAIMKEYRHSSDPCLNRPLMMKIDDDTFVAGHRFRDGMAQAAAKFGTGFIYAGVPIPDIPRQQPIRDPKSPWYEPLSTWSQDFPPAMYGGTGYVMGRQLIEKILDNGIADQHILWNEDRAVGAWAYLMEKRGATVNQVVISGTNGFSWDRPVQNGMWKSYPYVLHHHLNIGSIRCLTMVDHSNNPDAGIDHCFR
mmetsp:Transcript_155623/g.290456  ORF Transcript_155623/g.290456 Transcript_155623/m.290456 type:complete len:339 (+) Transcript_155623:115-1131(+)